MFNTICFQVFSVVAKYLFKIFKPKINEGSHKMWSLFHFFLIYDSPLHFFPYDIGFFLKNLGQLSSKMAHILNLSVSLWFICIYKFKIFIYSSVSNILFMVTGLGSFLERPFPNLII